MVIERKRKLNPVALFFQQKGKTLDHNADYDVTFNEDRSKVNLVSDETQFTGPVDFNKMIFLVRNKKTGAIRFLSTEKALLRVHVDQDQDQIDSNVVLDTFNINEKFGSKKLKRYLDQKKRTVIDTEVMKDKLEKIVADKSVSSQDIDEHKAVDEQVTERYAPPINRDAKAPEEVYSVTDIISSDVCESLKSTAEQVLEVDIKDLKITSYVQKMIVNLRKSNKSDKVLRCSLLLYADCVIKYLGENYRSLCKKMYSACEYSEPLNNLILNSFSTTSTYGRTRPLALKDKTICYLSVALLLANEFVVDDIVKLVPVINLTLPKIGEIVKVIGARLNDSKLVLKIPLAQPPTGKMKKSKR